MPDHPIQPQEVDKAGIIRFKKNAIVEHLFEDYGHNAIVAHVSSGRFCREDYDQLLQLIGYSVNGAPLSPACRARVPEFDDGKRREPSFEQGFHAGYAQAKRDALYAIGELDDA